MDDVELKQWGLILTGLLLGAALTQGHGIMWIVGVVVFGVSAIVTGMRIKEMKLGKMPWGKKEKKRKRKKKKKKVRERTVYLLEAR